ncbi:MAG: ATP-dependent zinc protease family protein [Gammaproteobacteria bacterium]
MGRSPNGGPAPSTPVGWREWLALPALRIPAIKAKMDTGARTSALHTFRLERYDEDGRAQVRFWIHPLQGRGDIVLPCVAEVIDLRTVSDSGGHRERRYVIRTTLAYRGREWPIELTLTNREDMLFRLLIGRSAMVQGGLIVDPARSYLGGRSLGHAYKRRFPRGSPEHEDRHPVP